MMFLPQTTTPVAVFLPPFFGAPIETASFVWGERSASFSFVLFAFLGSPTQTKPSAVCGGDRRKCKPSNCDGVASFLGAPLPTQSGLRESNPPPQLGKLMHYRCAKAANSTAKVLLIFYICKFICNIFSFWSNFGRKERTRTPSLKLRSINYLTIVPTALYLTPSRIIISCPFSMRLVVVLFASTLSTFVGTSLLRSNSILSTYARP